MLSHFQFSPVIIIWTLTFAALLVLLVVILGRDRAKLYPLFTFGVGVVAFRLLVTRILYGKLSALVLTWLFTALALLAALAGILVAVEMARRAFTGAGRRIIDLRPFGRRQRPGAGSARSGPGVAAHERGAARRRELTLAAVNVASGRSSHGSRF